MNVSELEKMGRNLMDIALQYTHPNFEGMYPDWGAVCNIGEELVRMSEQPQLNENQLKTIKSWGNLAAGEFGQEWTEDDELTYRELFGESLTVLPDEVEEAE